MVRKLGRLPFLRRQRVSAQSDAAAVDYALIDPDSAPLGPPILLPATIFRQVLVAETELTPSLGAPTRRRGISGSIDRLNSRRVDRGRRSVDGQTAGDEARAQAEGGQCARGQPPRIGNEAIAQHAQTYEQRVASLGLARRPT